MVNVVELSSRNRTEGDIKSERKIIRAILAAFAGIGLTSAILGTESQGLLGKFLVDYGSFIFVAMAAVEIAGEKGFKKELKKAKSL